MASEKVPIEQLPVKLEPGDNFADWRQLKQCETKDCGHWRKVQMCARRLVGDDKHAELSWTSYCTACQAMHRAKHYARLAVEWKERWEKLKIKQANAAHRDAQGKPNSP